MPPASAARGSVLGLHRPSLPADEYFSLGLDGAAAAHRVMNEAVAGYLGEMGDPVESTSLMLATSHSDMVWLPAEDIRTNLDGIIAEYAERLRDRARAALGPRTASYYRPVQAFSSAERLTGTDKEDVDCLSARLREMQEERRQAAVARLIDPR